MYESFIYHPVKGLRSNLNVQEISDALKDEKSVVWIDMPDIEDSDIDFLTTVFNLHPLTVEDFIMPNPRPKTEKFKDYIFTVMFSIGSPNGKAIPSIKTNELDCCLGKNFLVTFHDCQVDSLNVCKERIRKQSPVIQQGADMLLYSILDACVESYIPVINGFDTLVDSMTDGLFKDPDQNTLKQIYLLKNQILYFRRIIGPQADVINLLCRSESEFITPSAVIYFRNIYDNLMRLNDMVSASRDIITGAMEAYVSMVSSRLNEIMKTLTLIATFMMPLTLVASIYGMNFKHMPELNHPLGYPMVIAAMGFISIAMIIYFKRRKWL